MGQLITHYTGDARTMGLYKLYSYCQDHGSITHYTGDARTMGH